MISPTPKSICVLSRTLSIRASMRMRVPWYSESFVISSATTLSWMKVRPSASTSSVAQSFTREINVARSALPVRSANRI